MHKRTVVAGICITFIAMLFVGIIVYEKIAYQQCLNHWIIGSYAPPCDYHFPLPFFAVSMFIFGVGVWFVVFGLKSISIMSFTKS